MSSKFDILSGIQQLFLAKTIASWLLHQKSRSPRVSGRWQYLCWEKGPGTKTNSNILYSVNSPLGANSWSCGHGLHVKAMTYWLFKEEVKKLFSNSHNSLVQSSKATQYFLSETFNSDLVLPRTLSTMLILHPSYCKSICSSRLSVWTTGLLNFSLLLSSDHNRLALTNVNICLQMFTYQPLHQYKECCLIYTNMNMGWLPPTSPVVVVESVQCVCLYVC